MRNISSIYHDENKLCSIKLCWCSLCTRINTILTKSANVYHLTLLGEIHTCDLWRRICTGRGAVVFVIVWIYNYLCNQCLSSLTLWVRIPHIAFCTRYSIMWLSLSVTCDRSVISPGTPVSSTNESDRHNITDLLFKVALNTIILTLYTKKGNNNHDIWQYSIVVFPQYCFMNI